MTFPLESVAYRNFVGAPKKSEGMLLPAQIAQMAEHDILAIERKINGLWRPKIAEPIEIPNSPASYYYENYSRAFTRSYFYKNLFKCLITSHLLRHHIAKIENIVDLGAGAGVFSVAFAQICNLKSIRLLDRSHSQIAISKSVFGRLNVPSCVDYEVCDFSKLSFSGMDMICSYSIGEALSERFDLIEVIAKANTFTMVESPFLISLLEPILKELDLRIVSGVVNFAAGEAISHLIEGGAGQFAYMHCSGLK